MVDIRVKWRLTYHVLSEFSPCYAVHAGQPLLTSYPSILPYPPPIYLCTLHCSFLEEAEAGKPGENLECLTQEFSTRITAQGEQVPAPSPSPAFLFLLPAPCCTMEMVGSCLWHCSLHIQAASTPSAIVIFPPLLSLRLCTKPAPSTLRKLNLGKWFTQPVKWTEVRKFQSMSVVGEGESILSACSP